MAGRCVAIPEKYKPCNKCKRAPSLSIWITHLVRYHHEEALRLNVALTNELNNPKQIPTITLSDDEDGDIIFEEERTIRRLLSVEEREEEIVKVVEIETRVIKVTSELRTKYNTGQ